MASVAWLVVAVEVVALPLSTHADSPIRLISIRIEKYDLNMIWFFDFGEDYFSFLLANSVGLKVIIAQAQLFWVAVPGRNSSIVELAIR